MTTTSDALDHLDAATRGHLADAMWVDDLAQASLSEAVLAALADDTNANRAFGERFRARVDHALAQPDSFTPGYAARYAALVTNAEALTPQQAYVRTMFLGQDSSAGYELLPDVANLEFPRHHHLQPQSQVGWHFFVGSVEARDGRQFGIECMFFHYALLPLDLARRFGLSDVENQVLELQLAVSPAGDRHYQADPPLVAGTSGLLAFSASGEPFRIALGRNSVESTSAEFGPLRLQARGIDRAGAEPVELRIDLRLADPKAVLLQGDEGCAPCAGGVGTLYYSIPRFTVDPSSQLVLGGETFELAHGAMWFDHQWGTGLLPKGSARSGILRAAAAAAPPAHATAWDWFEVQFDDNRQLTAACVHGNDQTAFETQTGPNPPGVMTAAIQAKWSDSDGAYASLSGGTLRITEWLKLHQSPNPSTYSYTDTWYPNRWEFSFTDEALPPVMRQFSLVPYVASGQENRYANGAAYREGAVHVLDRDGRTIGAGFAESVGYANTNGNMLTLAGLPDLPALRKQAGTSFWLRLQAMLHLLRPSSRRELADALGRARGL